MTGEIHNFLFICSKERRKKKERKKKKKRKKLHIGSSSLKDVKDPATVATYFICNWMDIASDCDVCGIFSKDLSSRSLLE